MTIKNLLNDLSKYSPKKISIATLLFKPEVFKFNDEIKIDYIGFNIKNEFVVGYGLDYNLSLIHILLVCADDNAKPGDKVK